MDPLARFNQARRHKLPFLRTLEDLDLLLEIRRAERCRAPLSMSEVLRLRLGSFATLQRQIRRLRGSDALVQRRSHLDRRQLHLHLTRRARGALTACERALFT